MLARSTYFGETALSKSIALAAAPALAVVLTAAAFAPAQVAPVPAAVPSTMPAVRPTSAPTTQSAEEKDVRAALVQYNAAVAAGDVPTLIQFISVSTPQQKAALALMGRLTTSGRGVYDAAVAKFGQADLAKEGIDRTAFPAGFPPMPVDDVALLVNGPKATLVAKGAADGAQPIALTKKDGQWRIDGDALLPVMSDKQLAEQTTVLNAAIEQLDQTSGDVKDGRFRAPDEIVVLLNHRVQKAVRTAQAKLAPMDDPAMNAPPSTGPAGPAGPAMPATQPTHSPEMP